MPAATDPRVARSRSAALEAAVAVVVEAGPSALTIEAVIERCQVARSTIYRHWSSRDELLVDGFTECAPATAEPPPGLGFEEAMRFLLHDLVRQLSDPKWARLMPAMMTLAAYEPTINQLHQRMSDQRRRVSDDLFMRGQREGLFGPEMDRTAAMAQIIGPLTFALMTGEPPLTTSLADRSLHNFLAGL